jgi:FKBP-type peptidyl-prolyl cis-trans isomerase 2
MKVAPTSFVTIDYLIQTEDNEFYPRSGKPEELSFCLGFGLMPPDLEEALIGMAPQDKKKVRLSASQAFGEVDENLIMEIPRADFAPGLEPEPGDVFETRDDEGHPVYFVVREVQPEVVIIDFNHPLAGKEVEFHITLKDVREATPEDIKAYACSCSQCGGGEPHSH